MFEHIGYFARLAALLWKIKDVEAEKKFYSTVDPGGQYYSSLETQHASYLVRLERLRSTKPRFNLFDFLYDGVVLFGVGTVITVLVKGL